MKITDYPMNCCGMVQASGIYVEFDWEQSVFPEQSWEALFNKIEEHQLSHQRNCAMIALSTEQGPAREQAQKRGWIGGFSFWNPNSNNEVTLYTKILWPDKDAFLQAKANGYKTPARLDMIRRQPEAEYAL